MKEDPLGQPTIHPTMKLTKGPERILEGQIILSYFGFLSSLTMMEAIFTLSRRAHWPDHTGLKLAYILWPKVGPRPFYMAKWDDS